MKYIKILFSIFLVCCIVAALWISASASELIPLEGYTDYPGSYPDNTFSLDETQPFSLDETQPFSQDETQPFSQDETQPFSQDETQPFSQDETQPFSQDETQPVRSVSEPVIVAALAPMTPSNTNGFQAVVLGLLGNYNPVVLEYAYTNSNGYVSYVREVQPDYSWMCCAAIFAIVLFCLFRLVGGLIKR